MIGTWAILAALLSIWHPAVESSWYARGLPAPDQLTAASRDYPRGTLLLVIHEAQWVLVRVNDYGPEAWTGRDLDLSRGAARKINLLSKGVGRVHVIPVTHWRKTKITR